MIYLKTVFALLFPNPKESKILGVQLQETGQSVLAVRLSGCFAPVFPQDMT